LTLAGGRDSVQVRRSEYRTFLTLEPQVDASLARRLLAEALGTGLLILFGPGSVVAALAVGDGKLDYAALGIIGLSFGLVVALVIHAFGSTSGAHINPAVTVALAATRRFPWREVGPYVVAQLLGAVVGGLLVVMAFGTASVDVSNVGATTFGPGVAYPRAIVVEALGTFLLMLAIMALAVDKRAAAGWAGLMIGLSVTCVVVVFGPVTGAAINPARAFGPYVASAIFGGDVPWSQLWAYVIGPLLGAVVAAISYDLLARPRAEEPAEAEPAQGAQGDIVGRRPSGRGGAPAPRDASTPGRRQGRGGDVRTDRRG
jgi:glycerol uptake facilitator protein